VSATRRADKHASPKADEAELLAVSLRLVLASCLAKQDFTDGNGCKLDPLMSLGRDIGSLTTRFILEGIPAVIVGVLIWFYLPDYPETAKFFSQEEKDFCARRMGPYAPKGGQIRRVQRRCDTDSTGTDTHFDKKDFIATLRSWQFWYFSIQYFFLTNSLKWVTILYFQTTKLTLQCFWLLRSHYHCQSWFPRL
jgi:hypothetical protein